MNKFSSLICMSILAAPALLAADEKPAPIALKNKSKDEPAPIELKNKSTEEPPPIARKNKSAFNIDAGTRSPFWPISWKPTGKVATGETDQGEVPPGAFLVTAITFDGATRFAIVKGRCASCCINRSAQTISVEFFRRKGNLFAALPSPQMATNP